MIEALAQYLSAMPDKYPKALERLYPHLAQKVADLWGKDEFDAFLAELMVADHEGRQGFPPEVGSELFRLSMAYEQWKDASKPKEADPWALERKMTREETEVFVQKLQQKGQDFSPEWMFKMVEQGETAAALNFLRAGMEVDVRRADEWTPLMVSLFNGHEDTAMMLLSKGANVRAKARRGYEPLHWAALNGYERAVDFIIEKGGDVNATTDYGWTPLLQAATRGQLGIVQKLVARGASVNAPEHEGWTPLHKACANGHVEVAKFLLERGADAEAEAKNGETPFALATKVSNFDLLALFAERGIVR
jgi:ankyrin repeat protein